VATLWSVSRPRRLNRTTYCNLAIKGMGGEELPGILPVDEMSNTR
jgi:hypothetical protein